MDIRVGPEAPERAAIWIARRLRDSVRRRGTASIALSGGSTAPPMIGALVSMEVPWSDVGVWQVDERVAPDGDGARNAGQLDGLAALPCRVRPMPVTAGDLRAAARRYGASLPERFDVVHLGLGDDGHTASWPPGRDDISGSLRPVELVELVQRVATHDDHPVGGQRGTQSGRAGDWLEEGAHGRTMVPPRPRAPDLECATCRYLGVPRRCRCTARDPVLESKRDCLPERPTLADLFADDPGRAERYVVTAGDLRIDYSKQPIDDTVLADLLERAAAAGVVARRDAMFAGEHINVTEDRAVMHTALRAPRSAAILVDGADVVPDVHEVLDAMGVFANRIRVDERITDVVNIGIGGSDLGPAMAAQALAASAILGSPATSSPTSTVPTCTTRCSECGPNRRCSSSRRRRSARSRRSPTPAPLAPGSSSRSGRLPSPTISSPSRPNRAGRRVRDRHRQHVRLLGLGRRPLLGRLGDRPVADDPDRPGRIP